ncbi:MAG TPA: TIGR02996 domain-containing protein [Gemmata sp.]|jgi:uncharacterized protein (TIGR02996 family)|nr:TIGR02996 domain-containing protein [Gemmata sp.]
MQTEVEAFLQRIRAFPDDDAPRLIFADWLEEQSVAQLNSRSRANTPPGAEWSEARGRFIRVQIALARLKEEVDREGELVRRPDREDMRKELEREEQKLLNAHGAEWMAPFEGLATGRIFHRGFVEEVNVMARDFLRFADELFAAGPLRHIHLLEPGGSLPGVLECHLLSRLVALTIHAQHAGEPLARTVARSDHLAGLKTLRLSRNRFGDDSTQHLATSPILANLEDLDLGENELGETSAQTLAASPHFSAIRRLELRYNRLGPVGAEAIAGSERLPNLQRLGLSHNEIGTARLHTLSRTHGFLRVPVLDLSDNDLRAAGLQVILNRFPGPADPNAIRLRDLDLSRNNALGDDGMRVLAVCPHLDSLQVLRLVGCGIEDEGLRVLTESPHLDGVVKLDLSSNPIGNAGCRVLLDRTHLRELRFLSLSTTGLSPGMKRNLAGKFPESDSFRERD